MSLLPTCPFHGQNEHGEYCKLQEAGSPLGNQAPIEENYVFWSKGGPSIELKGTQMKIGCAKENSLLQVLYQASHG